ncbi:putative subtilisin [Talaromyces proteolyticus]|uniref:Subtilisin n=1 Tax=Talaromyces proteolyticus TaxID=1131652 RepID=A0AAD4KQ06_9EURO|nr:putative subtilisin [Talaromyces proteolyticus]KAH8694068.1 putative subtilisin [Talaromyces proteolyticus]
MFSEIIGVKLLALAACMFHSSTVAAISNSSSLSYIPGRYLVEFADETTTSHTFFSTLSEHAISATPFLSLDYSLFKGASFNLHDSGNEKVNIQTIQSLPSVKNIHPVRSYSLPETAGYPVNQVSSFTSVENSAQSDITQDTLSTHVMTGVDKLRSEGYVGEGIKVAIVDTGIDYNHPALGGCFGKGCKVGFGKDLVGDDYTGANTPVPSDDPMDCAGHGTHVAGIIAANSTAPNFTGVAPNVTLGIYRVFGCAGSTADDVLIQAFMMAYDAGADVITASIGIESGWSEEPWAVAVSRIVEAGVPCTVAAGNDGTSGVFMISAAATGHGVTAVASVDNSVTPTLFQNASWSADNTTTSSFGWIPYTPADIDGTYPLFDVLQGSNDTTIACRDNFTIPSIPGKVALIPYIGYCTAGIGIVNKVVAAGSKYIMYYYDTPGTVTFGNGTGYGIDSFGMVSTDVAKKWTKLLAAGSTVSINVTNPAFDNWYAVSTVNNITGGYLSYFTSWGPTFEAEVKPQVAAPGGSILSTYPLKLGGYKIETGTSMATPFVAGSIALLLNTRDKLDPATINNLLSATAKPRSFNDGESTYPYLAPIAQQGGGLLNIYDAVHTVGVLNVSSIGFNDTEHFIKSASFEIKNTGKESVTYAVNYVSTGTVYTLPSNGDPVPSAFSPGAPPEIVTSSAKLTLSPDKVILKAGESASVEVIATPPTDLNASRIPVYGGYITLNGTNSESLSLPYLGVASNLKDANIFDTVDNGVYLSRYFNVSGIPDGFAFTLPPQNSTDEEKTKYDFPVPVAIQSFGSRVLRVDLVPTQSNSTIKTTKVLGVDIAGSIDPFPAYDTGRGAWHSFWYGQFSDGTFAQPGDYYLLLRALKIFGDENSPDDYESVETVSFSLKYGSSNATAAPARRSIGFNA